MGRLLLIISLVFFLMCQAYPQIKPEDQPYFLKKYPDTLNKKRLGAVVGGQTLLYGTSLYILYHAWYKDYPRSEWHWIDDNSEWMQMDKIGHATTSAYFGKFGYEMYRWAGVKRKKAIWIGGSTGFIFLTVVEVLDGFSEQWGASWGDFAANAFGTGLFISQQLIWNDQRFNLKWSYHETEYAQYRPDQLGSSFMEKMLKDYNGQTYWLSGNIKSFLPKKSKFPNWISVSFGYGANGMIGANSNPSNINGEPIPDFPRYRQYFFSLDVDLPKIKTRSHFLKFLFNGLGFIKIPFPTLEYNKEDGLIFHPLYF